MTFRGEYWFLSNFYPREIVVQGITYPSVEHYYQAAKFQFDYDKDYILSAPTAADAKRRGNTSSAPRRHDWDEARLSEMFTGLVAKFSQHPDLLQGLVGIQPTIIEDNTWGDTFWGRYKGHGRNCLGIMLMALRTILDPDEES